VTVLLGTEPGSVLEARRWRRWDRCTGDPDDRQAVCPGTWTMHRASPWC